MLRSAKSKVPQGGVDIRRLPGCVEIQSGKSLGEDSMDPNVRADDLGADDGVQAQDYTLL